ncbi:Periplasmic serine endoprotease DegP precursor [Caulifigura coniformis]|uniref:Periplasmic serine endoprotease DegP n=1 Tax=Caulifigura coniformis TaxID=2527983 RepID=A0A517SGS6_9PLAN|nr:trypsin-like peptidase domain-containing protein [Caulifigura coniformis]QDT55322.1 Periplasmic serine endoprotease DegP precursor [Caulifigura coniformis]
MRRPIRSALIRSAHPARLRAAACLAAASLLLFPCVRAQAVEPQVLEEQARRIDVIQKMAPSVVAIFAKDGNGGGSGVVVSPDGYVVTNFHVVMGQGSFLKCGLNDGKLYDSVLVGVDPTGDVAVIKLVGRSDFPAATIGDSETVRVGDGAYAVGNPFLLAADFQPTVTYGMVSGIHRYQFPSETFLEYTDCIQVDTSINPGNSGGPLFNEKAELIGINGRISVEKRGRKNVGAGYAISINQVMNFLDHLKSGRIVDHATLGAVVATNNDGTVTVTNILENSEAYRRGLQVGDELVSFAGRPIHTANEFKNVLGIYPDGWKLPLTYRRRDKEERILVRLRRLHRASELELAGLEEKKPREKPEPEKPPADPKKQHNRDGDPNPDPKKRSGGQPPQFPDEVTRLFEERDGYANFYFNRVAQDRLLEVLQGWGPYSDSKGAWQLTGQLDPRTPVQIKLGDEAIAMRIGDKTIGQPLNQDLTDLPAGSGGWLPAMHSLRQILTRQGEAFSDLYYVGSEPLDGTGPRVDVLEALRGESTCRWYFDQKSKLCVGMDYRRQEDVDECEMRFAELREFGPLRFPSVIEVRHAGQPVGAFQVDSLQVSGAPKTAAK